VDKFRPRNVERGARDFPSGELPDPLQALP
jgi:hypothetical protein